MKFDLKRPCGNCPFRSDRPFGLEPHRVREILGGQGRRWWPASSFPCHKTIRYGERPEIGPDAQQCAGVMIILHRIGRPNDAMQIAERFGLWRPDQLDLKAPVYSDIESAVRGQRR